MSAATKKPKTQRYKLRLMESGVYDYEWELLPTVSFPPESIVRMLNEGQVAIEWGKDEEGNEGLGKEGTLWHSAFEYEDVQRNLHIYKQRGNVSEIGKVYRNIASHVQKYVDMNG